MKSIMVRTFYVYAFLACFFAFGKQASAAVITHTGQTEIAFDTVWHEGDTHIITGESAGLVINYGAKLTLEPGAIIKLDANAVISVAGKLSAIGTAQKPVVITSIKDDQYGGDTNGDGSATAPAPGDWSSIMIPVSYDPLNPIDGEAVFDYAVVSYGGRTSGSDYFTFIVGQSSKFSVSNSELFDNINPAVILSQSADFSISHSNIYSPDYCQEVEDGVSVCGGAISSQSSAAFDVSGNYWGSPAGPTIAGSDGITWGGVLLGGNFTYQPFLAEKLDLFSSAVYKRHPVVLIPGILGSWPDNFSGWQIDPILHTYDDLLGALRSAGYEDGKTLFTLPYDWTQSNTVTAGLLKDKINTIKSVCVVSDTFDCSQVDVVGHSMGGIVARAYIEGTDYQNDVDQLIFIAAPHKGAPNDYLLWEGGDVNEIQFLNYIYKKLLEVRAELNGYKTRPFYDGVMYYVKEMVPSVRELLPIYDYLRDKDSGELRIYPDNYPINNFLENLNLPANLSKLSPVKITNILGDYGETTINTLRVIPPLLYLLDGKWEHGIPENYNLGFTDRGLELGLGDGTVPRASNSNFNNIGDTVISNASHLAIVSLAQTAIIKELTGQEPKTIVRSNPINNLLIFRIFSPADFQIIAPDGKRLGRDFSSTLIFNEVTNGYYSGFSSSSTPELAIITDPLPGNYQIKLVGKDNGGDYAFSVGWINDATSTENKIAGVILDGQNRILSFDFAPFATSSNLTNIQSDVTILSAINDISLLFDRQLLIDKNTKKKLIQQYNSLKLKVEIIDKLIKLAEESVQKLENNAKLPAIIKNKLIILANREIDKLENKRSGQISDALNDQNKYLQKLLAGGVLKQLGYDIIKSNNDYLINNW